MSLLLREVRFSLGSRELLIPDLSLHARDYWAVFGNNGSGKSAFAAALQNKLPLIAGERQNSFQKVTALSFEKQQQILEETFRARNNDEDPDNFGLSARATILSQGGSAALCDTYADSLQIRHLLDRPFIQLSTGESRKVLLCQSLVSQPDLLILDEPFEGLDQQSVKHWQSLLAQLQQQMAIVLIINRFNDLPPEASHIAQLSAGEPVQTLTRAALAESDLFRRLCDAEQTVNTPLPPPAAPVQQLAPALPVFDLQQVCVQYGDQKILDDLSWRVMPKEHWWIKGPNGAGKSTLLALLNGDHPQAYSNHVVLFGKQRGSGETVWEIKQKIGYVSSQLHMDYRVNCSALDVILSGFFDSIGVYRHAPDALRLKAAQWLSRLNLSDTAERPFRSLSWGQQRLLLIARAMVKYPPVLILDEPLQGLDGLNRRLVLDFIDQLVRNSPTQLLFVSHQDSDAPRCINRLFEFVGEKGKYQYRIRAL